MTESIALSVQPVTPVVGAVVIFTLTDRLNRAGLESVNQIIIGVLLILMVLLVKEGMYLRIRNRPWLALAGLLIGWGAAAGLGWGDSSISWLAVGMGTAIAAVLIPFHLLRSTPTDAPEEPESTEVTGGVP